MQQGVALEVEAVQAVHGCERGGQALQLAVGDGQLLEAGQLQDGLRDGLHQLVPDRQCAQVGQLAQVVGHLRRTQLLSRRPPQARDFMTEIMKVAGFP